MLKKNTATLRALYYQNRDLFIYQTPDVIRANTRLEKLVIKLQFATNVHWVNLQTNVMRIHARTVRKDLIPTINQVQMMLYVKIVVQNVDVVLMEIKRNGWSIQTKSALPNSTPPTYNNLDIFLNQSKKYCQEQDHLFIQTQLKNIKPTASELNHISEEVVAEVVAEVVVTDPNTGEVVPSMDAVHITELAPEEEDVVEDDSGEPDAKKARVTIEE